MARVTYVKKAQQRYAMVPVLDENGQPKRTPVLRKDGSQKTTKHGRPVFMKVTVADKTKPLPNEKCGKCGVEIKPGMPYKHISPKSGPYGGRKLYRCAACPTWQVWEYSSSMAARLAQMEDTCSTEIANALSADDVQSALSAMAEEVRALSEEKREGASNIEEGFGHPTYASEELEQIADDLENWADEIESVSVPEPSDYPCETCTGEGEYDCETCQGAGALEVEAGEGTVTCEDCDGSGQVECEDCTAENGHADMDAWREAVESEVSIYQECPV